jgi:hypothetical protein
VPSGHHIELGKPDANGRRFSAALPSTSPWKLQPSRSALKRLARGSCAVMAASSMRL